MEGVTLDDRFELERQIGEGAMGVVFRARDRLKGQPVAVKLVQEGTGHNLRRFEREAHLLAQLAHPGIVRYVAHGNAQGRAYLAMEWLEGETLETRLERSVLSIGEALALAGRVAEALSEAHRKGVVHRDLKPANLFLVGCRVEDTKVLDFGVARWGTDASRLTRTGAAIGTLLYMSPEQARGNPNLDERSDIFSLGTVLHEALTNRPAFLGRDILAVLAKILSENVAPLRSLRPEATPELEELLTRMLSKDPGDRPASAAAVLAAVAAVRARLDERESAGPLPPRMEATREAYRSSGGRAEQRVVSIVLVKAGWPPVDGLDLAGTEVLEPDALQSEAPTGVMAPRSGTSLREVRAEIAVHGGELDALIDGSLIVTSARSTTPKEQAITVARSALTLRRALGNVPMAICTGFALVQGRSALGEVIERSSRLLDEGPRAGIRVDPATARLLEGRFEVDGDARSAWLRGELDMPSGSQTLLGKAIPCIGRDRDLDVLRGYFDEAVDESIARAVLVTAPPGQGKTRVLNEFLQRLRTASSGFRLILGAADSLRSGSSFATLGPALRAMAGISSDASIEGQRASVRAAFGQRVAPDAAPRVCAFLGELVGVPFEDTALAALATARQEPRLMADQMLTAWLDWLAAECAAGPVLMVLDDLQWADLPSMQFLEAALRTVRDRPMMILALARPELLERFPNLWSEHSVTTLRLGGLSRKASDRLLQEALGERVTAEKRAQLAERADGNPFYLEELIRAVDSGAVEAQLPVTVLGMVHARLDILGEEAKHVVRAASIFGAEFREEGVRAVLGGAQCEIDVGDWLAILTEREIMHSRRGATNVYGFRHSLLREAAYALLTDADRSMCHRLVGQFLEDSGEKEALVVAEHFERGGSPDRAIPWYRRAATQAIEGNDLAGVITCAEHGIACGAKGELLGEFDWLIADARSWRGESDEVLRPGLAALELLREGCAAWFRASATLVVTAILQGRIDDAEAMALRMLAPSALATCDTGGVVGLAVAANVLCLSNRSETVDLFIRAMDEHNGGANPEPLAEAWIAYVQGVRSCVAGHNEQALRHTEVAADLFRRVGDLRGLATATLGCGVYLLDMGAYPRAEAALAEAAQIGKRMGLRTTLEAAVNLGLASFYQGKFEEAERILRTTLKEAESAGDVRTASIIRCYVARILQNLGKNEEAMQEGRSAAASLGAGSPYHAIAMATSATALLALGRLEEALADAVQAGATLASMGSLSDCDAYVRVAHAEVLAASRLHAEARSALSDARDRLLARAEAIADAALRESFLTRVPENARTMALAVDWGLENA
jgi:serine/threonine protein kinase/tetratricopeptide (TPR) repeat protein